MTRCVLCLLLVLSIAVQLCAVKAFEIPSLSRWRGPSSQPKPKHRLFHRSPTASAQPRPLSRLSLSVQALAREDSSAVAESPPAKSALVRIADCYNRLLASYPRTTQIASSVLVGGLGDVLLQALSALKQHRPVSIDAHRLAVFCAVSGCYFAPVVGSWFALLNRLSLSLPGGSSPSQRALLMTIVDQTVGAVAVNAGFFVAFELIQVLFQPRSLSAKALQAAVETGIVSMRRNIWRTLVGNWCCWPALNFVNFLYVPPSLRLLFSNVAAVFWNMFISSIANG